jgi:translation initiation factor IF-1
MMWSSSAQASICFHKGDHIMRNTWHVFMRLAIVTAGIVLPAFTIGCTETEKVGDFTVERSSVDGLPAVTATDSSEAEVKVQAVDYSNRSLALVGADGKSHIFHVSGDVRNFNQIKEGDVVKVKYEEELNVAVRNVNEPLSATELMTLETAPLGDKPGLVAVRTVQTLANVMSIDYETRKVALKMADGSMVRATVSPKLPDFDKVHVGDQVVFDYTEALTINVNGN